MFIFNKIVFFFCNPLMIGLVGLVLGWLFGRLHWRKCATGVKIAAVVWLWFWATALPSRWIGAPLEAQYPPVPLAEIPLADAIVELGGSMSGHDREGYAAEMSAGADRVWCSARLWKAGKAPIVVPSGEGTLAGDAEFLLDYGVPADSILTEGVSRNTEENARFVAALLKRRNEAGARPQQTILLVTSAWHMRRSVLMFEKYAPELHVIPVAADYEYTLIGTRDFSGRDFVPTSADFDRGNVLFKELIGYWGYRLFR